MSYRSGNNVRKLVCTCSIQMARARKVEPKNIEGLNQNGWERTEDQSGYRNVIWLCLFYVDTNLHFLI